MATAGGTPDIHYRQICGETRVDSFCCGNGEIDKWLKSDAKKRHDKFTANVTCAHLKGNFAPVGFFALSTVVESVKSLPGHHYHLFGDGGHFPCLQLLYIAVHQKHQGQGFGTTMLGTVTGLFAELGSRLCIPHLILVPVDASIVSFYQRMGFASYDGGSKMFLPLQSAVEAALEA